MCYPIANTFEGGHGHVYLKFCIKFPSQNNLANQGLREDRMSQTFTTTTVTLFISLYEKQHKVQLRHYTASNDLV